MIADELIAVVAERLNVADLKLNDQRVAGLSVGEFEVSFEEDDGALWLYVYADVIEDATALTKDQLLKLLRAHNLFNDVPNATFGVSRSGALTLFMRVQLFDSLSDEVWMAMFLSFLASLRDWREALVSGAKDEAESPMLEAFHSVVEEEEEKEEEEIEEEEIEALMELSMKRSERYRVMKKAGIRLDSIKKSFKTPTKMTVFSWDGPIDTVMTPMDSMRYYKSFLQSSLMSVESHTGHVMAYVGGIDYRFFKYDHVTQARRQVGSTFKPFLYTLAMQEGEYTPCTTVPNISYSIEMPDGKFWEPRDAGKSMFGEEVTLKWALAHSNNRISTYLMKRFGPEAVIEMARRMGVTSDIPAVPSICLGVCDISLYEMVGAMNTFANRGVYIKPIFITKIEDKNGNITDAIIKNGSYIKADKSVILTNGELKAEIVKVEENGNRIGTRTCS